MKKNAVITPATVAAAALAPKGAIVTAAQCGGQRPPVTTAVRWGAAAVQTILAYAATHSNAATKAHFGCSAHYVGALRKKHRLANYVAPKAPTPKAPTPKGGNVVVAKGGKRQAHGLANYVAPKAPTPKAPKGKHHGAAKLVAGSIL